MGIFDSYLADLQKEVTRVTDGVAKIQSSTQGVSKGIVKAIDELEDKVTNLPTEAEMKKKLKKKMTPKPYRQAKTTTSPDRKNKGR